MTRSREQTEQGFDFVLDVWQRRRWLALAVFAGAFSGVASLALSLPDLYRATTTVMVERQQVSEAFVRPMVTSELETRIQTIHKQVMSRARLSDIITRLNLYPELKGRVPMEGIAERMRTSIARALTSSVPMSAKRKRRSKRPSANRSSVIVPRTFRSDGPSRGPTRSSPRRDSRTTPASIRFTTTVTDNRTRCGFHTRSGGAAPRASPSSRSGPHGSWAPTCRLVEGGCSGFFPMLCSAAQSAA